MGVDKEGGKGVGWAIALRHWGRASGRVIVCGYLSMYLPRAWLTPIFNLPSLFGCLSIFNLGASRGLGNGADHINQEKGITMYIERECFFFDHLDFD
jgi:hypothetical protein